MTVTTNLHSASETSRSTRQLQQAEQLYAVISAGHDGLAFHVGAGGPELIQRNPSAKDPADRFRVLRIHRAGEGMPKWVRSKELRNGVERDRRLTPQVVAKHIRGAYSVALVAPGWVSWACIDIDAHRRADESELAARRRATVTLGRVWRALGCSGTRHPLLLRSPGGGYHVWLPLTRGEASANEHTWPADIVRQWVVWHLEQAGLELALGVIEVFPCGRCLRIPCGAGMVLLQATRPDAPDALGLTPWPGTAEASIDWSDDDLTTKWTRHVEPMVRAFVEQWEAQRRTLADWLGRPEAVWHPRWGFLGWRGGDDPDVPRWREIFLREKNSEGGAGEGVATRSQQTDDSRGCLLAVDPGLQRIQADRAGRSRGGQQSASPINDNVLYPPAEKVDPSPDSVGIAVVRDRVSGEGGRAYVRAGTPASSSSAAAVAHEVDPSPDPADGRLVRGRAFRDKVTRLLFEGLLLAGVRHDAVLTLTFYWAATCGLSVEETLANLDRWCRAHPHRGSTTMAGSFRRFLRECLTEASHYLEHYAWRWRFRGRGGQGASLATLTPADGIVVSAVEPKVANEVSTILAWLAGRADDTGRVLAPVEISHGLLKRLCGDRRVELAGDGKRHRAAAVALTELERLGVLTLARNYHVKKRGRIWSCWYRFGSGEIARSIELPAAEWEKIRRPRSRPTPGMLEIVPSAPQDAPSEQVVEVWVVGEVLSSEGLVRVLSDGARGLPRTQFIAAPGIERPTAEPAAREPWVERRYQMLPFTPGRLWSLNAANTNAGDVFDAFDEQRAMTRGDRLDLGGGGRDRAPRRASVVTASPAASTELATAPSALAAPIAALTAPAVGTVASSPTAPAVCAVASSPTASTALVVGAAPTPATAALTTPAPNPVVEVSGPSSPVPATAAATAPVVRAAPGSLIALAEPTASAMAPEVNEPRSLIAPAESHAQHAATAGEVSGPRSPIATSGPDIADLRAEVAAGTDVSFAAELAPDLAKVLGTTWRNYRARGRGS